MKLVVYGRPECHLCDQALEQIEAIAAGFEGLEIESIDIESDDDLMRRYLERIPVVEMEGETLSELVFDPALLRARLGIT